MPRQSPFLITLARDERAALEALARKYTSPYLDVIRAKIVLLAATGLGNDVIAARLNLPRQIVSKWRKRFFYDRLGGLDEEPRGGRRARFSPSVVVEVKRLACEVPRVLGVPLARWSIGELQREIVTRGLAIDGRYMGESCRAQRGAARILPRPDAGSFQWLVYGRKRTDRPPKRW